MRPSRLFLASAVVWAGGAVALFSTAPQVAGVCAYLAIVFIIFFFSSRYEEKLRGKMLAESKARFEATLKEIKERNDYGW